MQLLGNDAKYIKIAGNGQNALDFHISKCAGFSYRLLHR
jgi:hypothetical protein